MTAATFRYMMTVARLADREGRKDIARRALRRALGKANGLTNPMTRETARAQALAALARCR